MDKIEYCGCGGKLVKKFNKRKQKQELDEKEPKKDLECEKCGKGYKIWNWNKLEKKDERKKKKMETKRAEKNTLQTKTNWTWLFWYWKIYRYV